MKLKKIWIHIITLSNFNSLETIWVTHLTCPCPIRWLLRWYLLGNIHEIFTFIRRRITCIGHTIIFINSSYSSCCLLLLAHLIDPDYFLWFIENAWLYKASIGSRGDNSPMGHSGRLWLISCRFNHLACCDLLSCGWVLHHHMGVPMRLWLLHNICSCLYNAKSCDSIKLKRTNFGRFSLQCSLLLL